MPLVLSGTDGVSGVDGTASNPAIEGTDSNTGIFYPAADTVAIGTGGTERLRVDSAGNGGLGVTPAAWASGVKALQVGANSYASTVDLNNGVTVWGSNYYNDGGNKFANASSRYALQILQDTTSGAQSWRVSNAAGTAGNAITFTTAMTLDAANALGINTGSNALNNKLEVVGSSRISEVYAQNGYEVAPGAPVITTSYNRTTSTWLTLRQRALSHEFYANGSECARITSGGDVVVTSDGGAIGYGSGSGGTVTQATNKSTAVTLNKPSGRITMNNAALAAGASVSFQVFNNKVAQTDVVSVNVRDDLGVIYTATVWGVWDGYFYIRITNNETASRSDAVRVNFVVINGSEA